MAKSFGEIRNPNLIKNLLNSTFLTGIVRYFKIRITLADKYSKDYYTRGYLSVKRFADFCVVILFDT